MGLFRWKCGVCGREKKSLLKNAPEELPLCPTCGFVEMQRVTSGSTSVMENRDNGAMVRKLERYVNAEDLVKSHADSTKPPDDGIV